MSRGIWIDFDPYDGVAESGITSNVIDLRDAKRYTLSVRTTSGVTASAVTFQVSNATGDLTQTGNITESAWSTNFSESPGGTDLFDDLPTGVRWGRVLRDLDSSASFEFRLNKVVL